MKSEVIKGLNQIEQQSISCCLDIQMKKLKVILMVAPEDHQSQQDRLSVHYGHLNCVPIRHADLIC